MSDNNAMPMASMSDEMLLSRLFELVSEGNLDNPEVVELDATISQRLQQSYDDSKKSIMKLVQARAA